MPNNFRTRLQQGERLVGTMLTLASAEIAELMSQIGFDWLFLDAEHGTFAPGDLLPLLQAAGSETACIVRVPAADEVAIKKMLDIGADGIIVPQVNDAQTAVQVVGWAKYAPEGTRGVGIARAHGYGLQFQQYVDSANDQVAVIVQAEHVEAVENIAEIVATPGVDAVLLGPYDLAASMGQMGRVDHAEVIAAIEHVTKTCRQAKMPLGMFGVTADALAPYLAQGYTLVVASTETIMLAGAAAAMLAAMRE